MTWSVHTGCCILTSLFPCHPALYHYQISPCLAFRTAHSDWCKLNPFAKCPTRAAEQREIGLAQVRFLLSKKPSDRAAITSIAFRSPAPSRKHGRVPFWFRKNSSINFREKKREEKGQRLRCWISKGSHFVHFSPRRSLGIQG